VQVGSLVVERAVAHGATVNARKVQTLFVDVGAKVRKDRAVLVVAIEGPGAHSALPEVSAP
jgi:hypothetical protein